MKKLIYWVMTLVVCSLAFHACSGNETYADKLKKEERWISNFIRDSSIVVISQSEFYAQDSTTNVNRNEYVQLSNGVYMQIVDKGSANRADTASTNDYVLVRYNEYLITDSIHLSSSNLTYPYLVDEFRYTATSSTISGIFRSGIMYSTYESTAVPSGWLVIFPYIRDGAHVKLIVPSKMGHTVAMEYVYPYYYDLRKVTFYK